MAAVQSARVARLHDLIATRLGVPKSPANSQRIARALRERADATGTRAAADYLRLLTGTTDAGRREWDALATMLTVGESFFFRDSGIFEALRSHVLPELLDARNGSVRVWSAGCSDGQELYSVAMLLHEMGRPAAGGSLVGTDINPTAIEAARRARYRAWSFRGVDESIIGGHFLERGDEFELKESVRRGVTFRRHNLIDDAYPDVAAGLDAMDIILCRNVLIYFGQDTVKAVARKLVECLRPGGYLIVGNAEIHSRQLEGVVPRSVGNRVVYQRPAALEPSRPRLAPTQRPPESRVRAAKVVPRRLEDAPPPKPTADALRAEAQAALDRGDSVGAEAIARRAAASNAQDASIWLMVAHAYADRGRHDSARAACETALQADPFNGEAHLVLAKIADELGETAEAKALVKKAIYLDTGNADAHLTLASLYDRAGEARHAARAYRGALRSLGGRDDAVAADEDIKGFILARIEELDASA
ncbi:tetratricopeptide repeat protein [Candidatus Poribacteria bacterium]|jgi:chemotaxis protein methyltransferase CheR|nr:tetratricopeptide repeat protein [Candidatus Poribacteria bacterium]MBT5534866.1 tetratricopeptide repeat protein [Candidatus Poribacteria bacterium]MBT5714696.1 tetratricopeptide repeat protein [Candidatus Poribacteria bacterium]MBT7097997.1 tetratricopeptide repeat protein [Candidatus Poribacteria bacterium]MBT7804503.1 tetratricopeptide repeat protein [Candidatus Poribacteria bacterium]